MNAIVKRTGRWWWIPVIIILLLVNFLAAQFHKRIDLTNEKRFTISSPVKKLLNDLDDVVQVDIFLKGEFPSGFKKLAASTNDLLHEFKEYSSNNIQYRFIMPDEQMEGTDRTYADTLVALGVQPINLKVQFSARTNKNRFYKYSACSIRVKESVHKEVIHITGQAPLHLPQLY